MAFAGMGDGGDGGHGGLTPHYTKRNEDNQR